VNLMRKYFIGGLISLLMVSIVACNQTSNKIEAPDIIGDNVSQAKLKINGEFKINSVLLPTNEFLPGTVISYGAKINVGDKIETGSTVDVIVADYPANSYSLSPIVDYVSNIGFVTGPESPNYELLRDAGIGGTDLGIPVSVGDKMIMLYGDTFSGVGSHTGLWFSNFVARTSDYDLYNGLTFSSVLTNDSGMALPFAQGAHDGNASDTQSENMNREVTKIPTGGISIGNNVYLFYMSVRYWGVSGEWLVSYNQVVKSSDGLKTFAPVENLKWTEEEAPNFGQIFPVEDPNNPEIIYLIAIPGGRSGGTMLARVEKDKFENKAEYEYYTGKDVWTKGDAGLASLKAEPYYMLNPACSEMSIMYNNYLAKWMVVYLKGSNIIMQTATNITDEWSKPENLISASNYYGLYGGFVHQKFTKFDGKKFYIQVSRWLPIYQSELVEVVLK
jgi:hypothetical protein